MVTRPPACAARSIQSLTPPDPFLFLYPRWFQQQCRASARLSHTRSLSTRCRNTSTQTSLPTSSRQPARQLSAPVSLQNGNYQAFHTARQLEIAKDSNKCPTPTFTTRRMSPDSDNPPIRRVVPRTSRSWAKKQYLRKLAHNDVQELLRHVSAASANVDDQPTIYETIELHADVLRDIAGTASPNMWTLHVGSGCAVHVLPYPDDYTTAAPTSRQVELRGSPYSIDAAKDRLLRHKVLEDPSPPVQVVRDDWTQTLHVDDIARPPQWSIKSFYNYVRAILSHKPRQVQRRSVYGSGKSYSHTVSQTLDSLFTAQDSAPYASIAALRLALNFNRRHPELRSAASSFWRTAIKLGLVPDVDCFNQELGRLVDVKDINTAVERLFDMRNANVMPNAETWRLIFNRTDDQVAQQKILGALRLLGLLHTPEDRIKVSAALAKKVGPHFDVRLDSVQTLAGYMDHQIGPDWLSTSALNRLLRACLVDKIRLSSASAILSQLPSSGQGQLLMDAHTLTLLVRILAKKGQTQDAFSLLESVHLQNTRRHDPKIVAALFNHALQKMCLNTCRVLWCYAASRALITSEMRKRMKYLLMHNHTSHTPHEREGWGHRAASFIIGNNMDTHHFETVFPLLLASSTPVDVRIALSTFQPLGERRHQQLQLARLLFERDLDMWRFFHPLKWDEFLASLREAISVDKEQSKQATIRDLSSSVLIDIPLRKRNRPIGNRYSPSDLDAKRYWWYVNGHKFNKDTLTLVDEQVENRSTYTENVNVSEKERSEQANIGDSEVPRETRKPQAGDETLTTQMGRATKDGQTVRVAGHVRESWSTILAQNGQNTQSAAAHG